VIVTGRPMEKLMIFTATPDWYGPGAQRSGC
jgi:hypothetical protein